MAQATTGTAEGQQHPIKLYLVVWGWLFVLRACLSAPLRPIPN